MSNEIIALVVADINNPFFGEIVKGVNQIAQLNGYTVFICDTDEKVKNEISVLRAIKRQKVYGVIITPVSEQASRNTRLLESLEKDGIPVVLVDRDVEAANFDGVFIDNYKGAFDGVEALIRAGHKKIGIIAGPATSKPGKERLRGYLEALRLYDIQVKDDHVLYGDFKWESGYDLTHKMMENTDRPSAIFVSNNLMSIGCIKALSELKLCVPDDISLLVFDDTIVLDAYSRDISVISRSATQMGIEAAEIMIEKIRNAGKNEKQVPKRIVLLPKLELRGSEIAASIQ
ncbi:MAG: substrate-binding domain-containing protein [Bacillota bacterium]